MTIRSALTRCASTALCCALLTTPSVVHASPVGLIEAAGKAIVTVGRAIPVTPIKDTVLKILKDPSVPVFVLLGGGSLILEDSEVEAAEGQ